MKRAPILFYCQHLLGLGHWRRGALLASALAESGQRVLFVTGGLPAPGLDLGGAEEICLPPLTAADDAAGSFMLPDGRAPDAAYLAARRARLLEMIAEQDPAVVLLELFPFGRHAFSFELVPLLLALADDRRRRGRAASRVVVSLRDILVSKRNQPWFELTALAVARQWVDRVLVHGSRDLLPLSRTFKLAERLGEKLVYTGYLAAPLPPANGNIPRGEVVVSGGGGRVAGPLFRTALAARQLCPAARALPWRLITGPYLPPELRAELQAGVAALGPEAVAAGTVLETYRDDFPGLLQRAALSISQAGYNTMLDVVSSGVRAVLVPYAGSGDEQPLRAQVFAERKLAKVVPEAELSPARLAAAMQDALTTPNFPAAACLDVHGASRSIAILQRLVAGVVAAREGRRPGVGPGGGRQSRRRR